MFIIISLLVILGVTSYVFIRGWQSMQYSIWLRIAFTFVYFGSFGCFFLKMFYGDNMPENISGLLSAVGFTWLVAVIYFALFALSLDIIRLANHFFNFYPEFVRSDYPLVKLLSASLGVVAISLILFCGNIKFNNPKVTKLDISLERYSMGREIRIVMASDLHLSSYIGKKELDRYVSLINSQKPDIVILAGDIADRSVKPLSDENASEVLSAIKSRYGVFAISGNHEFYGGEREKIYDYIKSSGITFLLDSSVLVADSSLYIVGRDDRTNRKRSSLESLVSGLDRDIPKILLDHQPYNLDEAMRNGIDLQLSGHTHNGQFWPGNLIVRWIFELPYGYMKKGDTHYYVSSGVGLWGPKYRIGTESEIVLLNVKY